jgi:la-related protein 1
VKRRSKTSQQKESRPPSTGSDIIETTSKNVTVNNVKNSTAVNSNSVASTNNTAKSTVTNAVEGGGSTKKSGEKEELDFQFDEEIQYDEDMLHGAGGRHNNFSEFSDDEESDFELSDRDINKLLIVTQVKGRPPKHEGKN